MFRCLVAAALLLASSAQAADKKPFTQDDARKIVGDLQKVVTPNGIEKLMTIPVNGTQQWISIRGRNLDNPILLFIHGGPAAPEMPTSWTFQNGWEDYFTVVQWDQRGSGKTYLANDPAKIKPTLSKAQIVSDAEAVVRYLRATYHKDKIFVLGHSWGSAVGLSLAAKHPEWLYAYVGVGQMINGEANEREGYKAVLAAAEAAHNEKAVKELRALAPYPEPDGTIKLDKINIERNWNVALGGLTYGRDDYGYYYHAGKLSPDYTDADYDAIDKGSALSLPALLPDFVGINFDNTTDFRCPIILFEGRHDYTTPSTVAAAWFARVHAPAKKFVWFENSAHMVQIEEPGRVLVHLVEDVRPLANP